MKAYVSVNITKGWDTWNEMAEDLNSEMVSVAGMQFIYKGCDMDEKKVHMILEFESKMVRLIGKKHLNLCIFNYY